MNSTNNEAASTQTQENQGNTIKDPAEWTTGSEPITGAQKSYLHTLAAEAGEKIDDQLTKAGASEKNRRAPGKKPGAANNRLAFSWQ